MKKLIFTIVTGMVLAISALSFGYFLYRPAAEEPETRISITPERQIETTENTMIEYIYRYEGDNVTETTYSPIPPYLIGLTKAMTVEKMKGFDITYFSAEKVTAEKKLEGNSRQHFILGEKDGYLAVFYKNGMGLKEMTNTPINTLSANELQMLGSTEIIGIDSLAQVLQDIES